MEVAKKNNQKILLYCLGGISLMLGLSFASVPLYDLFCRVTGYGGTPKQLSDVSELEAIKNASVIPTNSITMRFDTNVDGKLPWNFEAINKKELIQIGKPITAKFEVQNYAARDVVGRAVFNVLPDRAAQYFIKIQCFCFDDYTLKAGEKQTIDMVYFIDPAILEDEQIADTDTIIMSYTYNLKGSDE